MKLDKSVVERRVKMMADEGISFRTRVAVGQDVLASELLAENDVLLLCTGATWPRDLPIPGLRVALWVRLVVALARSNLLCWAHWA